MTRTVCTVADCGRTELCRGLCNMHYHRVRAVARRKPCACGCGEQTAYTFKHGHHTRLFTSAEQSRRGRMNTGDALRGSGSGRTYIKRDGVHEHRLVAALTLGRPLNPGEVVHHKDGNKRNNDPDNLEVFASQADHARHHMAERGEKA